MCFAPASDPTGGFVGIYNTLFGPTAQMGRGLANAMTSQGSIQAKQAEEDLRHSERMNRIAEVRAEQQAADDLDMTLEEFEAAMAQQARSKSQARRQQRQERGQRQRPQRQAAPQPAPQQQPTTA